MAIIIDPNLKAIIKNVSTELELPEILITSVYYQYCKTLKAELEALPLKTDGNILSEEEFNKMTTSFNLKYIGKIYTTYPMYKTKNLINYGQYKPKEN